MIMQQQRPGPSAAAARAAGVLVVSALVVACGPSSAAPRGAAQPPSVVSSPTSGEAPRAPRTIEPTYAPIIDPADFSTTIDNPWFPLVPGTRFVYAGTTADGHERNVVDVTGDTKTVMGVRARVVHDVVSVDGKPEEETFDWYAQDR
jgi:hypothetical protein